MQACSMIDCTLAMASDLSKHTSPSIEVRICIARKNRCATNTLLPRTALPHSLSRLKSSEHSFPNVKGISRPTRGFTPTVCWTPNPAQNHLSGNATYRELGMASGRFTELLAEVY